MMRFSRFSATLGTTALLALALAGHARAGAYGISYNNVFDFLITPSAGITFIPPVTTGSGSSAALPPPPVVSAAPLDAAPENLGTAVGTADNDFTPLGKAGQYARGDAVIDDPDLLTAPGGQARNIGESFLGSPATGSGTGINFLKLPFSVGALGGTITFEFKADPYLEVLVNPAAPAGTTALSSLMMTIHGPFPNFPGGTWAPDGVLDALEGELADPFSLNTSLVLAGPGSDVYDPTGDASFVAAPAASGSFKAIASVPGGIGAGVVDISMGEMVETSKPPPVPGPATLFLLGSGIAGLVFAGRRKKGS